jgi:hypothetical protein
MQRRIDLTRLMKLDRSLPPSSRDPWITTLGIASFLFYALAAICAWQLGGWWGIGLVAAIFVATVLDDFVAEEHRQELIEMHGKLVRAIAEKSDILDDFIPKKL